jgi:hypothetical protein
VKIILFGIYLLLFCSSHLIAQSKDVKGNDLYLEIGGNGGIFSVNYERETVKNLNIRLGFSEFPEGGSSNSGSHLDYYSLVLLMANYLVRFSNENSSCLEIGIGGVANLVEYTASGGIGPEISVGYRYSPIEGGIMFQIAVTPLITTNDGVFPWAGISIGYKF